MIPPVLQLHNLSCQKPPCHPKALQDHHSCWSGSISFSLQRINRGGSPLLFTHTEASAESQHLRVSSITLCVRFRSFLPYRPHGGEDEDVASPTLVLSTGAPHGCMLSYQIMMRPTPGGQSPLLPAPRDAANHISNQHIRLPLTSDQTLAPEYSSSGLFS